jgi:uncharacterized protein YcbK (DUF882 family)
MNYFKPSETECKCGCGINNIDSKFMKMLNKAREIADMPFFITSGCRCPKHNKNVGGSKSSSHIASNRRKCKAVDIKADTSRRRLFILSALLQAGFTRIGMANNFIHVDNDETKPPNVIWLY